MNAPATHVLMTPADAPARPGPLVRSFERRRLRLYAVQILADVASVLCGFVLAAVILQGTFPAPTALLLAQLLLPVFLTIAQLLRL
jgi:hypothetical protein